MPEDDRKTPQPSWLRRIAWLVGIWGASIAVLAVVAYLLRILMDLAGMTAGNS
jgi:hypothetical protein